MKVHKLALGLAMAAATAWSMLVPDAQLAFNQPSLARILFFHLPCAITTSIFIFLAPYLAVRYLSNKAPEWDVRAASANELGLLFGLLTMATGILFSRVQWGAWWSWDPRQTSFLLVLLVYGAYFALRSAFADESKRAANAAAYSIAMTLPCLFLIFVFPRLPQVVSLHPSTTVQKGELQGDYRYVTMTMLVLFFWMASWLYQLRVRAGLVELALENSSGNYEAGGGHPAPTGVVRSVPVPGEDR